MPLVFEFMTTKGFIQRILKLRRDEVALSALLLVLTFVLNVLYIRKCNEVHWVTISGYDHFLQSTLTNWFHSRYLNSDTMSLYSHPGLGILMAPFSALNYIISSISGCNCANFVLAFIQMSMLITETILLKRIINEYIGLKLSLSLILSIFFSGMAYVLLMSFTPDHFAFSQFLLVLYVYLFTRNQQGNSKMMCFITICTACVTITNGIKLILSKLLFDRKQFKKCLFLNIIFLLSMISVSLFLTRNDTNPANMGKLSIQKYECVTPENSNKNYLDIIKPIYWSYRKWFNTDVSRTNSFINKMFGQSILFHAKSINRDNATIEYYSELWKNILNVLFIIMVICGIVISIKTKLMQLLLCFLSIDIFIHLVCCFGISELYIYSPHYLFIFVISIGYLIKHTVGLINVLILTIIVLMAFTLYIYNISEIINYLS